MVVTVTPTPRQEAERIAMNIPVSQLRTAIVELFPETDIGLTRMRILDALITIALFACEEKARTTQRQRDAEIADDHEARCVAGSYRNEHERFGARQTASMIAAAILADGGGTG